MGLFALATQVARAQDSSVAFAAEARAQLLAELERVHRQLLADADGDSLAIPGPPA